MGVLYYGAVPRVLETYLPRLTEAPSEVIMGHNRPMEAATIQLRRIVEFSILTWQGRIKRGKGMLRFNLRKNAYRLEENAQGFRPGSRP